MKSASPSILPSVFLLSVVVVGAAASAAVADEALAERAGCMNCHSASEPGLGPTYEDIASRYRGEATARSLLSEKLATGGAGNWTDETGGLSMPPYSNLLSAEEIQALVDWILAQEEHEGEPE
jgi:cytochrome c